MGTKVLISAKSMRKHLEKIQAATDRATHEDSVIAKIKALNRTISGWCRYFQYTSKQTRQFGELEHKTFWCFAHWLGCKFKQKMPQILKEYQTANRLGLDNLWIARHSSFASITRTYAKRFLKPNPYTMQDSIIGREEVPDKNPWLGYEARPGWADTRQAVMERDNYTCRICKITVTIDSCEVDHIIPYSRFKRPVDANRPKNLWTLCKPCHKEKTEADRRMESRMQ